ncbi:MAG: PKD domain-containing protein [Bacteroidota bacterium]
MKKIFIGFLLCLAITPLKAQTVAMTDDFSNPGNWSIYNDIGNTDDWVIGTGVPSGGAPIGGITSTTAGNGFALYDSDGMCSGDQLAYLEYAAPIVLDPTATSVTVSFEQFYREYTDEVYLDVSTDGGATWNFIQLNTIYNLNDQSPNPETVNVDITGIAAGQDDILIRFVFVSGPSSNGGDGCDYAWMVDDVSVSYITPLAVDDADFTVDNTTGCVGTTFTFTDASTGIITDYSWDFGAGANLGAGTTGQGPHPVTYATAGLKTVTLTINSGADTETKVDFIEVFDIPTIDNDPVVESQELCAGAMTNAIDLVGTGGSGLDFSWTYTTSPIAGVDIGIPTPGTGDIPAFTALNTTGVPITATFTITPSDDNCTGSPIDITITVNPVDDASFAYAQSAYCETSPNETPSFVATPGGTFSSTNPGFVVDPGTGELNLSASGVGTYDVTYMTAGLCPASSTLNIDIISTPTVNNPGDFTFCDNTATTDIQFTGTATTFTWNSDNTSFGLAAGGTGDILSFMPTGTGTATIEVVPSAGTCSGSAEIFTITVNAGDDASFSYAQASYCFSEADPTPTVTGTAGGTFTSAPAGLTIDPVTGEIDLASSAAGTYDVTYTTASATCPDANTVQVGVGSGPTVDPVADTTVCENASTNISFTGSAGATFSWTNDNTDIGLPASGSGDILNYIPANTTAASIMGTIEVTPAIGACTGTPTTFTITVDPAEDASFTISVASICSNDPTAPTTTVTGVAGGTFSSAPAGLTIDPNTGAIDVATSTPGSYTVTYTTPGTCFGTSTQSFDLIETPVISPQADMTACSGDIVPDIQLSTLSAFPVDWTNDNVNTGIVNASGSGDIASFIASNPTPGGPAIVSVISMTSDNSGCVSDTVRFNFTVNSIPTVSAGADRQVCEGFPITMSGTGSAATYTWDNGITNGVPFTPSAGSYIYTVTGTTNGCSAQDQATVTINPAPIVNAGVDRIVCVGSQAVLTASGAPTLSWNNGVSNNVPFVPFIEGDYVVTGVSPNGCTSTDTLVLTLEDLPIPSFTSNVNMGCIPTTVIFNSSATSNLCVYSFSDGTIENGCDNVAHTFTSAGIYDVTLTQISVNGCIGSTTVPSMIIINPDPVASFKVSRPVVDMIDPSTFFENRSTGAVSYEWDFGDLGTSTDVDPAHNFPGDFAGEYTVMMIATTQFGCKDTMTTLVRVDESIIYYVSNSFTPNGDEHNNKFSPLLYSGFDPQDYNLKIFDRIGELIFESNDASEGWDGDYGAGRGLAPAGTYTYKLQFNTPDKDEKKVIVGHVNLIR